MFRRQLFYGITIILLVVIIFLLLRGRGAEKDRETQIAKRQAIAVESSLSLRAIVPRDLEVVTSEASWTRHPGEFDEEDVSVSAQHDITIHNNGEAHYVGMWLRLEYVDEDDRPVTSRTHEVDNALPPGETLNVRSFTIDGLPGTVSDFSVAILSADLQEQ